jgi:fimbrial chaperone protein
MRSSVFAIAIAFSALFATRASAGSIEVTPTSVNLSAKLTSGMLALTNRGKEAVRFHVAAFEWTETPTGEMVLKPTKDLMFFPAMMALNPQEARNLRVGTTVKPGATEKAYRLFIQELPALARTNDQASNAVQMLTRVGVPVFIEGTSGKPVPALSSLTLQGQRLSFQAKNSGGKHCRAEKITVRAKDGSGKVIHSDDLYAWYLLANHVRNYDAVLPIEVCGPMKSLEVELKTELGSQVAVLPNATCTR